MDEKTTPPATADLSDEGAARSEAVQTQIAALRADMQRLQERISALQSQVASAMSETPAINARINAALARLAAAQQQKKDPT